MRLKGAIEPERVRKADLPPELMRGKPRSRMRPPALEAYQIVVHPTGFEPVAPRLGI